MLLKERLSHNFLFVILGLIIIGSPLFYSFYTDHRWEDYYIAFRSSKNLALGHGLVYNIGEKVHSFTSPFGVLIPAILSKLTRSDEATIWIFRLFSCFLLLGSWLFWVRMIKKANNFNLMMLIFMTLYLAFEIKINAFSMNGMETAFMLFFVSFAFFCAYHIQTISFYITGFSWAGLMWTRPDSCVYIFIFAISCLIFHKENRKLVFFQLLKAGAVCTVLYLPWFLWATWYYGSPVPNSVSAKSMPYPFAHFKGLIKNCWWLVPERLSLTVLPIYNHFGGWPTWIFPVSKVLALICLTYLIIPISDKLGKMISFCILGLGFYASYIVPFPWYFPMISLFVVILLSRIFYILFSNKKTLFLAHGTNFLILGFLFFIFCSSILTLKHRMKLVDEGSFKQIGLWLKDNIQNGESVFSEPLGYIGYYSEAKMINFPGLCSPELVEFRKDNSLNMRNGSYAKCVEHFKPDWIIMRPDEVKHVMAIQSNKESYQKVKRFDVTAEIDKVNCYGKPYLYCDSVFTVYKKK